MKAFRFFLALALLSWALVPFTAAAQVESSGPQLADYLVTQRLKRARGMIAQQQYSLAVQILGEVLADSENLLYRAGGDAESYRSLSAEAEAILASLPAHGLEWYETQYGPVARATLRQASADRDIETLEELTRKYLFTRAGTEAGMLVSRYYLNAAEPLIASLFARRVLRNSHLDSNLRREVLLQLAVSEFLAGQPLQSEKILRSWRASHAANTVSIGGREVNVFSETDSPLVWLEQVLGTAPFDVKTRKVWSGSLTGASTLRGELPWIDGIPLVSFDEPTTAELAALETQLSEKRLGRVPTPRPLFVGDTMVVRAATGLLAIDVESGMEKWRAEAAGNRWGYRRRVWEDVSWGAISTNGKLVFAVEDWEFETGLSYEGTSERLAAGSMNSTNRGANFLSAYDVRSGKLVWQVGTTLGKTPPNLLHGRFLTSPLPLGDQLYSIVEFPEGCRLVLLNGKGKVKQQWLLDAVEETPAVRRSGVKLEPPPVNRIAPPAYCDGLLVCATPRNRIVAMDLVTGSVLWSWKVDAGDEDALSQPAKVARERNLEQYKHQALGRWSATATSIHGDRVLVTCFESDDLVCLDLSSGRLLWRAPRKDGLYVAGVFEDRVIVIGRSALYSYRLDDGAPTWESNARQFVGGFVPAGRGYFSDGQYVLPATSGDVEVFDLNTGRLTSKVLPIGRSTFGNLVPQGNHVYSTGIRGVDRFGRLSTAAEELLAAPASTDDAETVLRQANVWIAQGEIEQALQAICDRPASLRDERFSRLLTEGLTLALRAEAMPPGAGRDDAGAVAARYERFVALTLESATVNHDPLPALCLAEQLVEANDLTAAQQVYARLENLGDSLSALAPVSPSRSVRLDRRIACGRSRLGTSHDSFEFEQDLSRLTKQFAKQPFAGKKDVAIDVKERGFSRGKYNNAAGQLLPIVVEAVTGAVGEWVASYEYRQRNLVVQDRWGRIVCELTLPEPAKASGIAVSPFTVPQHAVLAGDMLVYHRGDRVIAIDLAAAPPRVAWNAEVWPADQVLASDYYLLRQQLADLGFPLPNRAGLNAQAAYGDRTFPRQVAATRDCVCFHRGRELVAVDPRTGEEYWVRDDFPIGADLMGAASHLLVTPLRGENSSLLHSLDGHVISTCPVLPIAKRLVTNQGRALLFDQESKVRTLGLYDPVENRYLWQRELAPDALPAAGIDATIGIVDPQGAFTLVDLASGETRVEVKVGALPHLSAAALLAFGDTVVLALDQIANDKAAAGKPNPNAGEMNVSGKLLAVDADSGQKLWERALKDQRLRTTQFAGLQLLVACNRFQKPKLRNGGGVSFGSPEALLDIVDVRTGKSLRSTRKKNVSTFYPYYRLRYDEHRETAIFDGRSEAIELRFTAKE